MRRHLPLLILLFIASVLAAQPGGSFFSKSEAKGEIAYEADALRSYLHKINPARPLPLALPHPDGQLITYQISPTFVMPEGLAARYPQIRSYRGWNKQGSVRLEIAPDGLRAYFFGQDERVALRPAGRPDRLQWQQAAKSDFHCGVSGKTTPAGRPKAAPYTIGDTLRTYRLAVAVTGEYSAELDNDPAMVMASVVSAVNRVNEIYERDLSISMVLVDSTDKVFFYNPDTDPYTSSQNGRATTRMNQNQTVLDTTLGPEAYDVGHVFDSEFNNNNGVARLQSVCNPNTKGRGYTATNPPTGDLFAVDYFAHELGHQFGGNHPFNQCGPDNQGPVPYEPGGGTTIMAYAGICGSNNIQLRSDDYFHAVSIREMTEFAQFEGGNTCPEKTATGNQPPVVTVLPEDGLVLPVNTPFYLRGEATDAAGDTLTYTWEQYDLGPSVPLGAAEGNSPLFRSRPPMASGTRVLPQLDDLLIDVRTPWEILPPYTRSVDFRLTVRDGKGGVEWQTVAFNATEEAGPFRVTSQPEPVEWRAGSFQVVEWDVAGTHLSPVDADSVEVYLMQGMDFENRSLIGRYPNEGQAVLTVPTQITGNDYRVVVQGADHIFFDLNRGDISIVQEELPQPALTVLRDTVAVCGSDTARFTVFLAGLNDFTEPVLLTIPNLPDGFSVVADTTATPPSSFELALTNTGGNPSGFYEIDLIAAASGTADTVRLTIELVAAPPAAPALLLPVDDETGISVNATFSWEPRFGANRYEIQISDVMDFTELLFNDTTLTDTSYTVFSPLPDSTQIYWRVRAINEICGAGPFSPTRSLTTEAILCLVYTPEDLPVAFNSQNSIRSTVIVREDYPIRDVNILNLSGRYFPVGQLRFRLTGSGVSVDLIEEMNCATDRWDLNLDDEAPNGPVPCPYKDGKTYQPADPLSVFQGRSTKSAWRLQIFDQGTNGALENWELELCVPASVINSLADPVASRQFSLFPNPGTTAFTLRWTDLPVAPVRVELYDLVGRRVFTAPVHGPASGGQETFRPAGLNSGLYLYRCLAGNGQVLSTGKWMVR